MIDAGDIAILLVEDDHVDAMLVERAFAKAKITNKMFRAYDGLDALEKMRDKLIHAPYIILLDLNMPKMNGLEFLDEIRKDKILKDTVVFVLTTSIKQEDVIQSYNYDVSGYFVKDHLDDAPGKIIETLDNLIKSGHLKPNQEDN